MEPSRPISPGTWGPQSYLVLMFVAISSIDTEALSYSHSSARLRVMRSAHDAQLECERHGLRAAPGAELQKDALKMPIHGPFADAERSGDLLRGLSERDVR